MSRCSVVLRALGPDPASTSELYDRVGYPDLARVGLIPYAAFRETLVALVAEGSAETETAPDGTARWWRRSVGAPTSPQGPCARGGDGRSSSV